MEPTKLSHDQEWVIQISRALEEGFEDNDEAVPISIFNVPKTLMSMKPETYAPQLVALGPYHHQRLELLEMEHYKLASAKRVQNNIKQIKFRDLVNSIAESDSIIRACHLRFLEFDREKLAWMFAIDASFLLECLHTYASKTERSLMRISPKMAHLIDHKRKKTAHHAILRDIIMLENQIPLFLLREVHGFYQHEDHLASMLLGFCKDLSPIKCVNSQHFREECFERAHLLELLYYMVTPKLLLVADCEQEKSEDFEENIGWFKKALKSILTAVFYINLAPLRLINKICKSKSVKILLALPFTILSYILNLGNKGTVDINSLISSAGSMADEVESASHEMKDESPLAEEIAIPSVSDLQKIGVKFRPAKGGLGTVNFEKSSGKFYLPVIHLDDNSEVVLRNLVAYEACIAPEVMVLTRYTELMNGIIDSEEDVRILREAGIIVNRLKSDVEVTTLWNGMTKSLSLTKVPILDKAIEGANTHYSRSWKVKMNVTMKKYVFASWPFLTFLAANILMLLSIVQTACSMYDCSKLAANMYNK
ncbi:hypothetical protein I3843_07G221200 [Carya illinoinensis]|uniref:Uncharacterized protein n=1 Tax=Carya illinoinensis TaxID=32201 RepID=A0A8T1Q5N6_CARIL|nr:putative UPF0481 protein At3g02645 [Carya illinoinensis]KAG6649653.1 hypothetical protein CIPAW_07G226300 [Carya illinoinensis]KAG6706570.1 hypothetical protein I3842_07G227800 [Carya illinoinensis]KAG7973314.1 hypothetical protein I3843_07G221200 [Carya illinoinensis]